MFCIQNLKKGTNFLISAIVTKVSYVNHLIWPPSILQDLSYYICYKHVLTYFYSNVNIYFFTKLFTFFWQSFTSGYNKKNPSSLAHPLFYTSIKIRWRRSVSFIYKKNMQPTIVRISDALLKLGNDPIRRFSIGNFTGDIRNGR